MSTPDANRWPLPHPDLLRIHAGLSQFVRCAGAGGGAEDSESEDDDEVVVAKGELNCRDYLEEFGGCRYQQKVVSTSPQLLIIEMELPWGGNRAKVTGRPEGYPKYGDVVLSFSY